MAHGCASVPRVFARARRATRCVGAWFRRRQRPCRTESPVMVRGPADLAAPLGSDERCHTGMRESVGLARPLGVNLPAVETPGGLRRAPAIGTSTLAAVCHPPRDHRPCLDIEESTPPLKGGGGLDDSPRGRMRGGWGGLVCVMVCVIGDSRRAPCRCPVGTGDRQRSRW